MFAAAAATTALLAASPTVTTADPGGGDPWTARLTQASGKRECAVVTRGTTSKGRYCAVLGREQPFSYAVRYETPPETESWRTVFVVTFTRAVERATLQTPEGVRRYRRNAARTLLVVLAGRVEQSELRAVARVGGRRYTATAGRARTAESADPLGGAGWRTVAANERGARRVCVSWERAPLRFGGTPPDRTAGRDRCGRATSDAPVRVVETVEGRTVIFGLVGERVADVFLRTAGGEAGPRVAFDRRTRSYLAVVAEGTDVSGLVLRLSRPNGTSTLPADGGS